MKPTFCPFSIYLHSGFSGWGEELVNLLFPIRWEIFRSGVSLLPLCDAQICLLCFYQETGIAVGKMGSLVSRASSCVFSSSLSVCLLVCPADVLCWQTLPLLNQCQRLCLFKLLLPFGLIDGKFCIAGGNSVLEGWEMKGKELIKGFSVLWKKLLHSCRLPTAILLTRAFTLGSLCVYMHIYLWVAHTWQFSKASGNILEESVLLLILLCPSSLRSAKGKTSQSLKNWFYF